MTILKPFLKELDEKEILRYAGMRTQDDAVEKQLKAAVQDALLYCAPKSSWQLYQYKEPFVLAGGQQYQPCSEQLRLHLQGSVQVAVLAVTVGEAVEKQIDALFHHGEYTKAMLLDAAATQATEQTADQVCRFIHDSVKKQGLFPGKRFSPGYGDWDIQEQPHLLQLSGAGEIGLDLTKSLMLVPRKSVTAIIGLKPFASNGVLAGTCEACEKKDCQLRRKENA